MEQCIMEEEKITNLREEGATSALQWSWQPSMTRQEGGKYSAVVVAAVGDQARGRTCEYMWSLVMDLMDLRLASSKKLQLIVDEEFQVFQLRIKLRIEGDLVGIGM